MEESGENSSGLISASLHLLKLSVSIWPMEKPVVRRPRLKTKEQAGKAKSVSEQRILEVFEYWRERVSPRSRAVLDHERRQRIGWAIHDYGVDGCKKAIDGILKSPWHMGQNPQNKKYADVELIFRSAANVEKFMDLADIRGIRDAEQEFINEQ